MPIYILQLPLPIRLFSISGRLKEVHLTASEIYFCWMPEAKWRFTVS